MSGSRIRFGLIICAALFGLMLAAPAGAQSYGCGGKGGTRSQTFTCGTGEFVTKVVAGGGAFLSWINFQCSSLENGQAAYTGQSSGTLGGNTSSSNAGESTCPKNSALVGFDAYCGLFVDRLDSLYCRLPRWSWDFTQALNVGGSTGNRRTMECPEGSAVHKVRVRSGNWIDRLEIYCRPLP